MAARTSIYVTTLAGTPVASAPGTAIADSVENSGFGCGSAGCSEYSDVTAVNEKRAYRAAWEEEQDEKSSNADVDAERGWNTDDGSSAEHEYGRSRANVYPDSVEDSKGKVRVVYPSDSDSASSEVSQTDYCGCSNCAEAKPPSPVPDSLESSSTDGTADEQDLEVLSQEEEDDELGSSSRKDSDIDRSGSDSQDDDGPGSGSSSAWLSQFDC